MDMAGHSATQCRRPLMP